VHAIVSPTCAYTTSHRHAETTRRHGVADRADQKGHLTAPDTRTHSRQARPGRCRLGAVRNPLNPFSVSCSPNPTQRLRSTTSSRTHRYAPSGSRPSLPAFSSPVSRAIYKACSGGGSRAVFSMAIARTDRLYPYETRSRTASCSIEAGCPSSLFCTADVSATSRRYRSDQFN